MRKRVCSLGGVLHSSFAYSGLAWEVWTNTIYRQAQKDEKCFALTGDWNHRELGQFSALWRHAEAQIKHFTEYNSCWTKPTLHSIMHFDITGFYWLAESAKTNVFNDRYQRILWSSSYLDYQKLQPGSALPQLIGRKYIIGDRCKCGSINLANVEICSVESASQWSNALFTA